MDFKKVNCPKCSRTISHYLSGNDSIYRNICPKCQTTVIIYSAGKTAIQRTISTKIEFNIKF